MITTDDVRWYFCEAEGAVGVRSSFGAMVDAALSGCYGGGGSNGVEHRAVAVLARNGGPWCRRAPDPVGRHRRIRDVLHGLPAETRDRHVAVLWAAFGPHNWTSQADHSYGKGTGHRLTRALGSLIGVALITDALRRRQAEQVGPPRHVDADGNRWLLAGTGPKGEPLYRCSGPVVSTHRVETADLEEVTHVVAPPPAAPTTAVPHGDLLVAMAIARDKGGIARVAAEAKRLLSEAMAAAGIEEPRAVIGRVRTMRAHIAPGLASETHFA